MVIHLKGDFNSRRVWLNGKKLTPAKSQKIYNHSPDGFSWGYEGSGCAQLALAICIELNLKNFYQEFKRLYISTLPQTDFDKDIDINFLERNL